MSLIIPANTLASGGFSVDNSCRFNEASADSLHRATSQTNGSTKWTLSTWIKRSTLGSFADGGTFMGTYASTSKRSQFAFLDNDKLYWNANNGAGTEGSATTAAVFRDVSAWYHVVLKIDTTQSSQSDRCKIYVNNVEQSLTFSGAMPAQNEANTGMYGSQYIGASFYNTGTDRHFGGYLAETVMIDNSALEPDQFGEFDEDSGIWKPIDVSGLTFGTNGFYCDYKNSSALGNDANGSNNLTVTNLTAIDQSTDTCTINFCTMNGLAKNQYVTLTNGNISSGINNANEWGAVSTTIAMNGGKWYCEAKVKDKNNQAVLGIYLASLDGGSQSALDSQRVVTNIKTGNIFVQGLWSYSEQTGLGGASNGDIYGIAFDSDNGSVQFYKNGSAYGSAVSNSVLQNETFMFATQLLDCGFDWNFGSPAYAISSGNTDGNDRGNFEYAVPSGYLSLCTANLSEVLG